MPWTFLDPDDKPWFELAYSGMVTAPELHAAFEALLPQAVSKGKRQILADCRDLLGGHTPADLLDLIERYDSQPMGHGFREAVLMRPGYSAEAARFYETACLNRGFQVQVFEERSAAEAWLRQMPAAPQNRTSRFAQTGKQDA